MEKTNFLKKKGTVAAFAVVAVFGGFFFLQTSTPTGNIIKTQEPIFSLLGLVGLFLIVCAMILALYCIRKKA